MDRFDSIIARYLDGTATSEECADLARLLRSDSTRARAFLDLYELDRLLHVMHAPTPSEAIDEVLEQLRREADPFVESVAREVARPRTGRPSIASLTNQAMVWLNGWTLSWRWRVAVAMAFVLVVGFFLWIAGPVMGDPVVSMVQGTDVIVERGTALIPAAHGLTLQPGDMLRTGNHSTLSLSFGKETTRLTLSGRGELKLNSFRSRKRFHLSQGILDAEVMRQRPFAAFLITTPNASATVIGTRFTLTAATNLTRLEVAQGMVRLASMDDPTRKPVKVAAGHYAEVSSKTELSALPQTSGVLREYWTNLLGDHTTQLERHPAYPDRPDGSEVLTNFAARTDWGDNFGDRFQGYVHPPVTGKYVFWVAGDPNSTLNLSRNENPDEVRQIGITEGTRAAGQTQDWDLHPVQRSTPLTLIAGRRYYIEAIRKTDGGLDHLAVAWQPPGGEREVIPGKFLSPFKPGK